MGTVWRDRFSSSESWEELEAIQVLLSGAEMPEDTIEQKAFSYALAVVDVIAERRASDIALEVTPSMLQAMHSALAALRASIDSVLNGTQSWEQAQAKVDAVLDAHAKWPTLKPKKYLSGIKRAMSSFEDAAGEQLERLESKASGLDSETDALAEKQELLSKAINDETKRISVAIAELETDAQSALTKERDSWASSLAEARKEWEDALTEASVSAEATLKNLRDLQAEAENVVHSTSAALTATDYGAYSKRSATLGYVYDAVAGIVGIVGLYFLIRHLLSLDAAVDANIGIALTRLAISVATLGAAGMVARRGSHFHREAKESKRTELALRQVNPFTANLEPNERREVVKALTTRVFIEGNLAAPDVKSRGPGMSEVFRRSPQAPTDDTTGKSSE